MLEVCDKKRRLTVALPLTNPTGKVRVKARKKAQEYGIPHPTRSSPFVRDNYVEWQISYDIDVERSEMSTLPMVTFKNNKGKTKAIYELSEYLYHFHKWNLIKTTEIQAAIKDIEKLRESDLLSDNPDYGISRTGLTKATINGVVFHRMAVKHPQLVRKIGEYIIEIVMKEKQRAVGVQPMLFLCIPITKIKATNALVGRKAEAKEHGTFVLDNENYKIVLEMMRIFGMLSPPHRADALAIMEAAIKGAA